MKKNNILSGALILSVGGAFAKIFSAIYRIMLTRILGGEGIGLYQLIFPIYSLCVVLASSGLPMAISKVVSRHANQKAKILKKCIVLSCSIALGLATILALASQPLANLQGEGKIWVCYLILAPTIIIVCATSVVKGYFQGIGYFTPSTIANISEQFVKLLVGLGLSFLLIKLSLFASIIGAVCAIVASELISLIIMFIYFKFHKPMNAGDGEEIGYKQIFKDIFPILLSNVLLPISGFVDSLLVVNLLAINFTKKMSIFLYGLETGVVSSLVNLPTIFSFAIASVLLPSLTIKTNVFNKTHKLALGLKIVLIIALPCVICFCLVPNKIIQILYADKLSAFGVEGLNVAYRLLTISGMGVVFLAINQLYSSCLQAVDKRYITVVNLAVAVVVKFVIEIIFMPSVSINIYALAIANTACYITAMMLNHLEICKSFRLKFDYLFMCKLLLANAIMLFVLLEVFSICQTSISCLLGFVLAGVVYLFVLWKIKVFSNKDLAMLKYK